MAALTDLSDVINRCTGGNSGTPEVPQVFINNRVAGNAAVATVAGQWTSLWHYEKSYRGSPSAISTSAVPTSTTNGALFPITDAGGSREKWLLGAWAVASQQGTIMLYDRLVHMAGLSGTTTTAQTTNLPTTALTRNTAGYGNMIMIEIQTQIGATATTATVDYKINGGTTKTSKSFTIGGGGQREVGRCIFVPLADGDDSVITIENLDLVASTLTAGDIGICIVKPICILDCQLIGGAGIRDFISGLPGPVLLEDGVCLGASFLANGTTVPYVHMGVSTVEA